jgi:hypothetical protein
MMAELNVDSMEVFEQWLEEEKTLPHVFEEGASAGDDKAGIFW